MPAQWQKYSLKTQQELMRGRDSLQNMGIYRWIDEGVAWLNMQFEDKGLEFATSLSEDNREVLLRVFRKRENRRKGQRHDEQIFKVIEPVQSFVSHLTVTKIILIAG